MCDEESLFGIRKRELQTPQKKGEEERGRTSPEVTCYDTNEVEVGGMFFWGVSEPGLTGELLPFLQRNQTRKRFKDGEIEGTER